LTRIPYLTIIIMKLKLSVAIAVVVALLAIAPEQVAADDCGVINPLGTWICCRPRSTRDCNKASCYPNRRCPSNYVQDTHCCVN
ncbi:hypothetical protein BGW41_006216, partial [Actinomortierella wolfii]